MNETLAKQTIEILTQKGVEVFCVCSGGRAAPFIDILSKAKGLKILYFFEERSAAFFALGRAKRDGKPAAVITTSGTAVAELLPATIESHYSNVPLVLVTTDRPLGYGEKGSPQTLKNPLDILKSYTACSVSISETKDLKKIHWNPEKGSLHLNVAFDTPLLTKESPSFSFNANSIPSLYRKSQLNKEASLEIKNFFKQSKKPCLIVGELHQEELPHVENLLKDFSGLLYLEPLSQLSFLKNKLFSDENILFYGYKTQQIDGVIRLGGVPRNRFWRNLEKTPLPVLNLSSPPFYPGIKRTSLNQPLLEALPLIKPYLFNLKDSFTALKETDKEITKQWKDILEQHPFSEHHWIWKLQKSFPEKSKIFLGNSLPIRLWDKVSFKSKKWHSITGQGGVNGIDGLVSRFLGECMPSIENLALIGDLSLLYDMNSFWHAKNVPAWTIFVINNKGGQIFSQLFSNPHFLNTHAVSFFHLAKMWDLNYETYHQPSEFQFTHTSTSRIIEIHPNNKETQICFQSYDSLWKAYS